MKKISLKILPVLIVIFCFTNKSIAQTLTTDKPDYPPGDTAILTGAGFQPGEAVTLQVMHAVKDSIPDTGQDHLPWTVTADTLGNFTTAWHVCEDDCVGATLLATADGSSSGDHAEAIFTDALKTDTYPLLFAAFSGATAYCQGAAAANLSASWSNTTCNGTNPGNNSNVPVSVTWYRNSVNSTTGGTIVQTLNTNAGTNSSVYTPSTNVAGTFYYYVVVSWSAGTNCAAAGSMTTSSTKTVIINSKPATPTITAGGALAFCQGGSVVLSSSSSAGNQWYNASGVLSGETGQNYTATTAGSYSTIVTIAGCSSAPSAPATVTVNSYPTAGVSILSPNPSTICSGNSTTIKFNGTANASLSYNKNGVLQSPVTLNNGGIFSLSTGILTSGTVYEVASVTSNGCTTTSGFSPASVSVTVLQPPVVITQPVSQSVTYGNSASFSVSATGDGLSYQWQEDSGAGFNNLVNSANLYSGVTTTILNIERPTAAMNGYKYRVVVTGTCAPTATSNDATLTVNKAPLTVTADNKNKVYGEADPELSYTPGGTLFYGDSYSVISGVTMATQTGSAAVTGTYPIVPSGGNAANYSLQYVNGVLTVSLRSITVTANGLSKIYGNLDPVLSYQITSGSLAYSDTLSGALSRAAGETVSDGPYAIEKGTLANNNYSISFVGASFSIVPLPVSVTADGKNKVYGSVDPPLTFISEPTSGSALPNGAVITFTGALSRVAGEDVGVYAINPGSLANPNYSISYVSSSLTVTPLSVSVTADSKTKIYGSLDPLLTYVSIPAVGSVLSNGAVISFTGNLIRAAGEDVGIYAINQGSLNNANYGISYTSASLSVTPLSVSVTADGKTKDYGSVDPLLTYVSSPTLGSLLPNGTAISFSGALERAIGEDVGIYAINRGNLDNTNYNISYTGANFTISPASVVSSVSVSPNPQQYSDPVTYCAIVKGGAPLLAGGPQAASFVTFMVGSQVIATNVPLIVSGLDIKATYTAALLEPSPYGTSPTGQMAPGVAVVTASISGANSNYSLIPAQPTTALTIQKENDPVYYTGGEFASTGSSTSNTAKIRLAASVTDDPDGNPGDIRNARVRFKIQPYACDISMTPEAVVYTSWRTVALVSTLVTTVGTAYLDTTFNIGTCDAKIYDITVEVSGYYTGNSDIVTVTVAKSMNDFVSGGGHLNIGAGTANKSFGVYKSSDNSKTNFGFNVKYNKNKTNLQGNANIIIRSGNNVYQVKGIVGGSNGSLNTNISDPKNKKAVLTAKANMIDMATGVTVNYGSNATMELKMTDKGEPGANVDTYGITIWGSNGSLLYSSNWSSSTNSTGEVIINGGNIQVGSTTSGRFMAPDSSSTDSVHGSPVEHFIVKIFPNPVDKGSISISINGKNERAKTAQLYIFDVTGKLIHSDEKFCVQNCDETVLDLDRRYVAGIYLVELLIDGKVYHQKLIVQ